MWLRKSENEKDALWPHTHALTGFEPNYGKSEDKMSTFYRSN